MSALRETKDGLVYVYDLTGAFARFDSLVNLLTRESKTWRDRIMESMTAGGIDRIREEFAIYLIDIVQFRFDMVYFGGLMDSLDAAEVIHEDTVLKLLDGRIPLPLIPFHSRILKN